MCGRATLTSPAEEVAEIFDALPIDIGPARFNVAPSQPVVTVRSSSSPPPHDRKEGKPPHELAMMRWGLIPWWAKPEEAKRIGSRCIQARAETAPGAPAFRDAFKRHRCLVVFDGFFEWKTMPDGKRVPHHIRRSNRAPFAVAGLWDTWHPQNDDHLAPHEHPPDAPDVVQSCAVLTTHAAGAVRAIHTRMPLILTPDQWDTWLEGTPEDAAKLLSLDKAKRAETVRELVVVPVSTWVNNVKHEDARCIEPLSQGAHATEEGERGKVVNAKGEQIGFSFAAPATKKRA